MNIMADFMCVSIEVKQTYEESRMLGHLHSAYIPDSNAVVVKSPSASYFRWRVKLTSIHFTVSMKCATKWNILASWK
jgi:hypothetical protein